MKRLKGPDLKMPKLKAPAFLVDLYWDLRDRHLLPLVALGIVAIVAVPFLLGGGSGEQPPPTVAATSAAEAGADTAKLTVVEAKPGLRDYRKRLHHRSPTDPFEQRYTSAELKGTKLGGGEEESSSTSTTETTETTKTTETSNGTKTTSNGTTTTESSGGAGPQPSIKEFTIAIDVKITRTTTKADGKKETSEPTIHHRVIPPAALPSEKTQAVVYMGTSPKTKQPLLLISDGVTSIFGEGKCLSGAEACQLLEVEPGFPETFVFGPNSTRYKITVLNPRPVLAGSYER